MEKETIKPTPTADKLLSIIANRFNLRKSRLEPGTTFGMMGVSEAAKEVLLIELQGKFFIEAPKDPKALKTIWNLLQWVESAECTNREGYYK